uniref:Loxtox protein n=1 Tax=Loxosceles similis TaxID=321804 RepID=A0A1B2ASF4_LOXSM|nr:loxtox protein [Loxosceles similis]
MEGIQRFGIFIVVLLVHSSVAKIDYRRPIYVIGHMVNSIGEVKEYLDRGSNVLESDISFHTNGNVEKIYHGPPCDCNRTCTGTAKLSTYLDYVREITNPYSGGYSRKLILQFFDLKLDNVSPTGKFKAGQVMADHVLDHLWVNLRFNDKLIRVLLYINSISDKDTVVGFIRRFKERGVEHLLKNVGFDGGLDNLKDIKAMWESIRVKSNVWQGDGVPNCLSHRYPDQRLREELDARDAAEGYIDKVYHWTIDDKTRMRKSLDLEVDGMITNVPEKLVEILQEQQYANKFRLATVDDDPFQKFVLHQVQ